jgi:catechol 2,3-dioxygenase-like lactoylglutathione lyase family enzyme
MLRHIGIHIHDTSEAENFYSNILNFQEQNSYFLNEETALKVFGTSQKVEAIRMKQFELIIELLICPKSYLAGMAHVALEFWRPETITQKATKMGYKVQEFAKENGRIARYITDKAGNIFEIKDINLG